ncbi:MAG TPA: type II toxin-antitoxin system RelE/ParE family toxin [Nitrospirales bacterium]|nr:type II toxin-antitoxin system RelE/ParE family toxin [Nitrospirales bacterium]
MDRYRVFEAETFQRDLVQLGRSGLSRIEEKLREHVYPQLRTEPHHGPNIKRLKRWSPPTWRYRIGAWRFFFEIDETDKTVYMTAADHRSRSYR